jgi:hypothetical protein
MPQLSFHSPVGELTVSEENGVLVAIDWGWACDQEARAQLLSYFDGDRQSFDLPLAPQGTAFQKTVWAAMQDIPYGLWRQSNSNCHPLPSHCCRSEHWGLFGRGRFSYKAGLIGT